MKKLSSALSFSAIAILACISIGCSEKKNDLPASKVPTPSKTIFQNGTYVFNSRVEKGAENCNVQNANCLTLENYKLMCLQVSSITGGMKNQLVSVLSTDRAFNSLLKGGNFDGIEARWLDKDSWSSDSGIIGACEVTVKVSGIFEGTSTKLSHQIYAKEFVVENGEVLLHSAGAGSAYML